MVQIVLEGDGEEQDFLSLEDLSSVPPEVISLIYTSNSYGHVNTNLNFAKEKLSALREKYTCKQNDLSELLFS